ncbi:hypothetical protein EV188_106269 [Actinomycetospora succinea]|uniref:Uncharacterized protein n=1 Tax=Actinomycetospora succinea TaxID=663603 RepID=A0A4R6V284_9PSEU|nr:hypothetical protein [Actinomycetospora succinea]TDQ54120.1 hypothetical protein EV188_106269 [Actinomycetospora succinea]
MARETQRRSRWQLTTRSRFALVLGLAGLAVAGVQVAMLSDPPTVIQIVVVAFWGLVGFGYLLSAAAQWLRGRREAAPTPPVAAAPVEEIVPVPVRPARPRARREESAVSSASSRDRHGAQDREVARPAGGAARTEAVRPAATRSTPARPAPVRPGAAHPEPARPEPAPTEAVRPAAARSTAARPARPEPARPEPVRPEPARAARPEPARPARPEPARTEAVRRPAPTAVTATALPRRPAPPVPQPAPEPTTVAIRPRTPAPTPARPSHPVPAAQPATAMLRGFDSSLSFGAGAGDDGSRLDPLDPATPVPALALPADVAPAPRRPAPISGPLPTFGDVVRGSGRRHAADEDAPAPRRPRHQADVEDPVAARRGTPGPNSGRHASVGHAGR